MTVRKSKDNGKSWDGGKKIHSGPSGYSQLVYLGDGKLGLLFEAGEHKYTEQIVFATFSTDV